MCRITIINARVEVILCEEATKERKVQQIIREDGTEEEIIKYLDQWEWSQWLDYLMGLCGSTVRPQSVTLREWLQYERHAASYKPQLKTKTRHPYQDAANGPLLLY